MKMKALKYIAVLAASSLLMFQSCISDKAFLEEHPKAMYTIDNAFETCDQVDNQLTLCYIQLYSWFANISWGSTFQYKNFGTDVLDQPYFRGGGSGGYSNFSNWTALDSNIKQLWTESYKVISYANLALMGCENPDILWNDPVQKNRVIGEAHFFRGFSYLRLAEAYGGVPIVKKYDESTHNDYVRASRAETYQFAIEELTAAYNGLTDYPELEGKIGKGAAAHMLAEAYLALGVETGDKKCYTDAADYAKKAIALHPLMTERFGLRANPNDKGSYHGVNNYLPNGNVYSDLFTAGNFDRGTGNTEGIWVIQTATYEQGDNYGGQKISTMQISIVARDLNWAPEYVEPAPAAAGPWKGTNHPVYGGNFSAYVGGFGIAEMAPTNWAGYDNWTDPTDLRYQEDATVRTKFLCFDQNHSLFNQYVTREMIDPNPDCLSKFFPMFQKIIPLDDWTYRDTDFFHMNYSSDAYAIRSAETYLLLAEAYLRAGDVDNAVKTVNVLRERAKCTDMYTTDGFDINDILDERARELLYEEARWFTFLRMEPEVWKQRIYDHAMYWSDYKKVTTPIAWNLWPIPQDIIDLNTGAPMEQNAGWK